jgi:hypothetical protein
MIGMIGILDILGIKGTIVKINFALFVIFKAISACAE